MKKIIIANWKMNPQTADEAEKLSVAVDNFAKKNKKKIIICPPFVYLESLSRKIKSDLGSQDVSSKIIAAGTSHTGEISAKMLKNLGVKYVIAGHSERRGLGETNEIINKKIKEALKNNLRVIFCVGESSRAEGEDYLQFIREELAAGLNKVPSRLLKKIIIAYEPIWAISSAGRLKGESKYHPDAPEDAYQMSIYIKRVLVSLFGKSAINIPILYGGSVDEKNAKEFLEKGNADGLLVGRTSWSAKSFNELLKNI